MTNTKLLSRLRDLHEELVSLNDGLVTGQQVDDSTLEALGTLVTDINDLVDKTSESGGIGDAQPVRDEIMGRIVTFETRHPVVAQFLSQLTDMLGMIGI